MAALQLARDPRLPEIGCVKSYPCVLPLAAALALVFAAAVHTDPTWQTDFKKAQEQAKADHKLLLVDFTGSDWCPPCKMLQKEIFSDPEFKDYASKNLVLVEVDFPRRKQQPKELALQNQELATRYGIEVFPSVFVFSSDGKQVGAFRGYAPGTPVKEFIAELDKLKG